MQMRPYIMLYQQIRIVNGPVFKLRFIIILGAFSDLSIFSIAILFYLLITDIVIYLL